MKHTIKQSNKARLDLINYHGYRPSDFRQKNDKKWELICKDDVEITAFEVLQDKIDDTHNN
jgi:hypothetical protein